jgi:3-phenylpropionate/trans-cinnamate dioxygenase ferredoxin reductase subunit
VRVDGPFGAFTTDGVSARRFVFVAGGIGITPMRSMLLAMRDRGDRRPAVLFFAAHDRSRAMFADELEGLQAQLDLRVVFVFEEPGADERCERGFLTAGILRGHLGPDLSYTHFFVCGPPAMMDALERMAAELGVPAAQMHTERFDLI